MESLAESALQSGDRHLTVDLLTGIVAPPSFDTPETRSAIDWYVSYFPGVVERSNSDMSFIKEATLAIEFQPKIPSTGPLAGRVTSPYRCHMRMVDDRGRSYEHMTVGSVASEKRVGRFVQLMKRLTGIS